jgi:phosphomannomutase
MTLIKSISGIRGTIGGTEGENLTPRDVVTFTSAFGELIRQRSGKVRPHLVIGRDARISGSMVRDLVCATLNAMGIDVTDCGLSTTPTVEMAVVMAGADGGIILTASHNPAQWNALKLLNEKGEFISADEGAELLRLAGQPIRYADVMSLGTTTMDDTYLNRHIAAISVLPWVGTDAITEAGFRVAVDGINSSGGFAVPALLKAIGVKDICVLHGEPNGHFAHNPEPLPEHLSDLSRAVVEHGCHVGISVDPDVDRLALVCEDGSMFGEEYTLVAVADHILSMKKGATVSNLSSSRALRDVTRAHGCTHYASAVGEVNVVTMMKEQGAVIGGEGNGGIIVPDLHYGRDALAGIAIFLTHLARKKLSMSALKATYPPYVIIKNKVELTPGMDVDALLRDVEQRFAGEQVNTTDGVKIDFDHGWVHLRKSNTEPIVRIYAEAKDEGAALALAEGVMAAVKEVAGI